MKFMKTKKLSLWTTLVAALITIPVTSLTADDDDKYYDPNGPLTFEESISFLNNGWEEVYVSVEGTPVASIDSDEFIFSVGNTQIVLDAWRGVPLTIGNPIIVVGWIELSDEYQRDGILYELEVDSISAPDGTLIASKGRHDDDDDDHYDDDDHLGSDDDDGYDDDDDSYGNGSGSGSSTIDTTEALSLAEGMGFISSGLTDIKVLVEGAAVSSIGTDDYVFAAGTTQIVADLWDGATLTVGETVQLVGSLKASSDYAASGYTYELEVAGIFAVDGTLIASDMSATGTGTGGTSGSGGYDDDDDHYDDDDDHLGSDDDGDSSDDNGGKDSDDDHNSSRNLLSLDEAIARLAQGWEEAYISVEGTPTALLDDDDYLFVIDGIEVVLDAWDGASLVIGELIQVTGELEFTDDYSMQGILYELDAMRMKDTAGNRLGDDDADDSQSSEEDYGKRAEGTLAELVAILEQSRDNDINVRTTGILGDVIPNPGDDDDNYLFSDDSGVVVVLDLDSRANVNFALTPGIQLEIIGELDYVDADDYAPEGIVHELDAVWIRLADGTTLDVGQMTPLSESTVSDWIGYFWEVDEQGWYYHPTKGFVFGGESFGDDDWFFSANLNEWVYATRQLYPFIFASEGGWHYLMGSSFDPTQHAYNYTAEEWIMDYWHPSAPAN